MTTYFLEAETDVEIQGDAYLASSDEPWLGITRPPLDLAGSFVEIRTALGPLDRPSRPMFRFTLEDGRRIEAIGHAHLDGSGGWTGRMPSRTIAISVSPTNQRGPFRFAPASIEKRAMVDLLRSGWRLNRGRTRSAILTRLIGWTAESDLNLRWAVSAKPFEVPVAWPSGGTKAVEPKTIPDGPQIRIVIRATGDPSSLRRTLTSLRDQSYGTWSAVVLGSAEGLEGNDDRIRAVSRDDLQAALWAREDLVIVVEAGDRFCDGLLEFAAEQSRRAPKALALYGDETVDGAAGPSLKPGWSPRLQTRRPYLGRALFVKDFAAWPHADRDAFFETGVVTPHVVGLWGDNVVALRRILIATRAAIPLAAVPHAPPTLVAGRASIIVPTRDHPAMLRRLVASIRARSRPGSFEIVVVDNASRTDDARVALRDLARGGDLRVIDDPAPFNFSRICNEAAATCASDVFVFLNDDMEVLSDGWLDRLIAHALDPTIGAVGAKLTYPDGRLQHIGMVGGMGGSAGHFGAYAPGTDPGWVGRNAVVHEVSAVTGACLAVSREKFEAVGGFDTEHLPIELSDVDLCFKLNARGWQTVVDPDVHLMHEESVSRGGATFRRLSVHAAERACFFARWRHVLRDDPFFHPALSLYSHTLALG